MKKNIYLFIVLHLTAFSAYAQDPITLTELDPATLIQIDTASLVWNFSDYDNFGEPEQDILWVFSDVEYIDPPATYTTYESQSTGFPEASYYTEHFRAFAGDLQYTLRIHTEVTKTEHNALGEEIPEEQVLSLAALSGNVNDFLVFPKQVIRYTGNQTFRKFPITLDDHWTRTRTHATNFNLTISAFGLNNTPGYFKRTRITTDTVVGYGEIELRSAYTGDTSRPIKVLQVQERNVNVDSFYVGGSPAPKALLDAFGLVQGKKTTLYRCEFFKQGELRPMVDLDYNESPFLELEEMTIHQSDFQKRWNLSAESIPSNPAIKVLPNPVTDQIVVELDQQNPEGWSYTLTNMFGATCLKGELDADGIVPIPNEISNGNYVFSLYRDGLMQSTSVTQIQH